MWPRLTFRYSSMTRSASLWLTVVVLFLSGCGSSLAHNSGGLLNGIGNGPLWTSEASTLPRSTSRGSLDTAATGADGAELERRTAADDSRGILGTGIQQLMPRVGTRGPLMEPNRAHPDGDYERLPPVEDAWWFVLRGRW